MVNILVPWSIWDWKIPSIKGQLGVPLTVYLWYLLYSLEILGDNLPINTHYIGLSHDGVHPCLSPDSNSGTKSMGFHWHHLGTDLAIAAGHQHRINAAFLTSPTATSAEALVTCRFYKNGHSKNCRFFFRLVKKKATGKKKTDMTFHYNPES